jgi:hypothetical protein
MDHRLFISAEVITKPPVLFQRLSHPGHVSVSKNPKASLEEFALLIIATGILIRKECHDGLRNSQAAIHAGALPDAIRQFGP